MKKHLPNIITCLNLATGCLGIVHVFTKDHDYALVYVLLAAFFDLFDGMAARLLKVQGEFGKQIDSLADMISFGALPGLYLFAHISETSTVEWLAYSAILVIVFSGLRLAKFNIDKTQSDKFYGLPTPANAIMLTSIAMTPANLFQWPYTYLVVVTASCAILVSRVEMIALKFKHLKWKGNELRFLLVACIVVVLAILGGKGLVYVIPMYILISIAGNLFPSRDV
ncbi:MAG: CDP-alcohol phosphatidyltransferase family protein [Cyclobacteriaceae bacterium]|nr:CDP-alcohol phosphatidyltransferase family protein [Cyclobacteriaceae bacterium HetDA_MAG_MS6]